MLVTMNAGMAVGVFVHSDSMRVERTRSLGRQTAFLIVLTAPAMVRPPFKLDEAKGRCWVTETDCG